MAAAPGDKLPLSSLAKALRVLDCFTVSQPELGVTDISLMLAINKSTVYNILATFEAAGYVEQDRASRRYRLGLRLLHLGQVVREGLGLRRVALPLMLKARDHYQETIHLTVEQGGEVVYIESLQPPGRSVARLATGKRAHMHCTGVGKAILAYMPDEQVEAVIAQHGLPAYTPNTITSPAVLREELHKTRQRGYAVDDMEHEWGIRCIAVPLRDEQGTVRASMSVSGPAERLPLTGMEAKAQQLLVFGLEISRRLGWLNLE
jgi:IclR family KDG regulon transcriptional repressor